MKKIFFLLSAAALLLGFNRLASIADEWDTATLEKANTAKDASYLTDEEKKVVFYTNLVRMKPELFAKTFYTKFLDSTKTKSTSFSTSLKTDLLTRYKPIDILMPKQDLSEEAAEHAKDTGAKGIMGHFTSDGISYETRIKKFKSTYGSTAENCDYGYNTALAIVIHQMIDEGIGTVEHRKTLMDKSLKYMGASIQPHKKEKWTCVMEFANDKK